MKTKNDPVSSALAHDNSLLIVWDDKYLTNIEIIAKQHKALVDLINELYQSCRTGDDDTVNAAFKDALSRSVEYVRFHFSAELEILARIKYPQYAEHKTQHDQLVKQILETAQNFSKGKQFVPNAFVRTLKDWVLSHIGYYDKQYAAYVADQKKKGLLTDKQITG